MDLPITMFNAGELSPKIDARHDLDKYKGGCRRLENMIPTKYGGAERRPGTKFIEDSTTAPNGNTITTVRVIPFVYSRAVAYQIELGDKYAKFYYGGSVLLDDTTEVWIATPYAEADLFELQYHQIGDVMWIVHPNYFPRKLSRTDVYTFELEKIDFRTGPFLIRNDFIADSTATLECSATQAGSSGTLSASNSVFLPGHVDALFKLIHPKTSTIVTLTGDGTSDEIPAKGKVKFRTHGRWTGTVYYQRKENNTDWENFRSYRSADDFNALETIVEESDNVKFRISTVTGMSAGFQGDITSDESSQEGIVKITAVLNDKTAACEVIAELASTDATRRWAEGAWSESRGYPAAITFFENRAIYAGAVKPLTDAEFDTASYPSLRL